MTLGWIIPPSRQWYTQRRVARWWKLYLWHKLGDIEGGAALVVSGSGASGGSSGRGIRRWALVRVFVWRNRTVVYSAG